MKLKAFQIQNYKSILDSGMCYINEDLTIFAGKNESGKTNVLSALKHLTTGAFEKTDYPARNENNKPSVFYLFSIDADFLEIINSKSNNLFEFHNITSNEFSIIINELGQISLPDNNIVMILKDKVNVYNNEQLKAFNNAIKSLGYEQELSDRKSVEDFKVSISNCQDENKEKILQMIENYKNSLQYFDENIIISTVKELLPKIIFFDSFKDNLPDVITKEHFTPGNEYYTIVSRLFKYLNANPEKIFFTDKSDDLDIMRNDYLKTLEKHISDDLFGNYSQKPIKLGFRMTSSNGLRIEVYDADKDGNIPQGDIPYKISDRSAGFRWFISFYITLKGENFSENDIILIDEPGLYLHAKAQRDMLKVFLEESQKHQFVFTTHSPYLIDVNNLSRIRLVQKKNSKLNNKNFDETLIISSILKGSDNETLTPILDAIGYDLNDGLAINIDGMAIVEGPSDYYYITKMADILDKPLNKNLIPANGAPKICYICAVLFGFKIRKIVCLYDNDEAGQIALTKNQEDYGFENITHSYISSTDNFQIEDMFSKNDFNKNITESKSSVRNSKTVEKLNKTILAKAFSCKNLSIRDFEEETINNFSRIIDIINA